MKNKRMICIPLIVIILGIVTGILASNKDSEKKPTEIEIRNICELATIETVYNNVVMDVVPSGQGISHIGEVDRTIWIEYTGYATIGIDVSKLGIIVNKDEITVHMPKAKILSIGTKNIDNAKFIITKDSWFNKNKISAKKQTQLINEGQEEMKQTIEKDSSLFKQAEDRAKELIENHIKQMGKIAKKEYKITWVMT